MLFDKVNFSINKGEKIAFVSRDPLAITSFFEIINDAVAPDSGKYEWGTTITRSYLPVENGQYFNNDLTLL